MSDTKSTDNTSKIETGVTFFFVAMGVITLTLGFFALIDFLPEKPSSVEEEPVGIEVSENADTAADFDDVPMIETGEAHPVRIIFDSLDREVEVLNPASSDVAVLDEALLSGVVRHPDSADFLNTGTIFLLGHSSYLPNVMNQNFQAFNGIQKLEWGDTIRLRSHDMEYIYTVDRVYEAKASSAEVPLQFDEAKLVLATCNSFGTKDDRFVVEASLVAKRAIPSS
jgi:LPXTG-site transpeptidase (sortase) family protein